jgi:hypothetical protein
MAAAGLAMLPVLVRRNDTVSGAWGAGFGFVTFAIFAVATGADAGGTGTD